MPHELSELKVRTLRRPSVSTLIDLEVDLCVVGAGIAGISAAIEAAKLGRRVLLVDALPNLGGQMINSLIGLFCGVFGNAPEHRQLTHGIFDEIFADLADTGALYFNRAHTTTVLYDELVLGRWVERRVHELGIEVLLGAVIDEVRMQDERIGSVRFSTRYGPLAVRARGYVDASGDASLAWEAGLSCKVPERPIYGSQQAILENVDEEHRPDPSEFAARLSAKVSDYGLVRRDGLTFFFPGRGRVVLNMTHIESPLDPLGASAVGLEGKAQVDRVVEFLRNEFPKAFANASLRSYGLPGRRQTRWIKAVHELSVDEVRSGTRFEDAVARTAWPIELHDRIEGYVWEMFGPDHITYVPLSSMRSFECANLLAAGRCIDGDPAALSSVRVMGPCAAMGAAAAHVFDLVGDNSVHEVPLEALRERLWANLET
jgi:2-polyprenyl-6-methoxyphenol hydroxylase-like FAD-dependent oxidoreductase